MGFNSYFAPRQFLQADVCNGSKADIGLAVVDVRFAPESGHCSARRGCPLCAKADIGHFIQLSDRRWRDPRKIRPSIVKRSRVQIAPSATAGPDRRMQ
jgi:hypothetical protein